jgi:hypothetical protein
MSSIASASLMAETVEPPGGHLSVMVAHSLSYAPVGYTPMPEKNKSDKVHATTL